MFKKYNVDHLLDLLEVNISFWPGLIHFVLIHQVFSQRVDELSFLFSGKYVHFGSREFCILTGLRYAGRSGIVEGSSRLLNKYRKKGKLKRNELFESF